MVCNQAGRWTTAFKIVQRRYADKRTGTAAESETTVPVRVPLKIEKTGLGNSNFRRENLLNQNQSNPSACNVFDEVLWYSMQRIPVGVLFCESPV